MRQTTNKGEQSQFDVGEPFCGDDLLSGRQETGDWCQHLPGDSEGIIRSAGTFAPLTLTQTHKLTWGAGRGGWGFVVKLVVVSEKIYIFLSLELFNKFYRYS